MTIPTPVLGLIMALASLVSIVVLLIVSVVVPDALYYVLTASVGAMFGGAIPSINVGGK